jgi:AraC-like DNA-binding protein
LNLEVVFQMQNSIIAVMPPRLRIFESQYHTPARAAQEVFIVALRAGHLQADPDYRIERRTCAGHDLLLCLRGRGFVQTGGRTFPVEPGELAWLNGHHPHAHWADRGDPWRLLWARLDGAVLGRLFEILGGPAAPVFRLPAPQRAAAAIRSIIRLLRQRPAALDALVHVQASALIGCLFEGRHTELEGAADPVPAPAPGLRRVLTELTVYYYRPWRVGQMASLAGLSVPHFFRCFQKATGTTPVRFLRQERISQAKRRLLESRDSIKEIAEQVGYSDPFYFSRDFKLHTGMSPAQFRKRELGVSR